MGSTVLGQLLVLVCTWLMEQRLMRCYSAMLLPCMEKAENNLALFLKNGLILFRKDRNLNCFLEDVRTNEQGESTDSYR